MEDKATIIPTYSPLDGTIGGHWTYSPINGDPNAKWTYDNNPEHWDGGWGHEVHQNHRKPNIFWNVKEIEKTAEIKDNFGFERFKVYLYASEEKVVGDEDKTKKNGWRVTVTALLPNNSWDPIFDSDLFEKLDDATKCYLENVKEYSLIAKVETKHYQDIKIYAEKIGYHRVEKCCANCRWCHQKMDGEPPKTIIRNDKFMPDPKTTKRPLICLNYKLFAKRIIDINKPDFDKLRIQPEVEAGCVCDHFEKRLPPHDPKFPNHCYDQYGEELS